MTSYILKNTKKEKDILLFEEKESYSFTPKKKYTSIKRVTILDQELLNKIWENKIKKEYDNLLKLIYLLKEDETGSENILVTYTEIDRIKNYLLYLSKKGLKKEILEKYLKKLYILESKLNNIQEKTHIGKGR